MPNPLSSVKPDANPALVTVGPAALMQRPDLLIWIADIIAAWPHLEMQLGRLVAKLLGTQAHIGVAIYSKLRGAATQNIVLTQAAEASLSDDDFRLFDSLFTRMKSAAKRRSNVAHGIWGYSSEVPNALLCVEAGMRLRFTVDVDRLFLVPGTYKGFPQLDPKRIQVYTRADFDDLFQTIWRVHHQFELFLRMLDAKPPERDELCAALSPETPDQKEILRLLWGDQSAQKSPPQSPPPAPPQE